MTRLFSLFPLAAALFAQNGADPFNKPPADVDKALRERITEFYQDHVTGQFRKAEELVAEDTRDFFYNHNKPRYDSFEIARIDYSDNFTRAKASVLCEQYVLMPGFGGKFKVPTPSTWKLENGQWYWYVDQSTLNVTPFGISKVSPTPADGTPVHASAPPPVTSLASPDFALGKIKVDKNSLTLRAGESGQLTLANTAPGIMTLAWIKTEGFEVTPDRAELKAGEKATVTVKALAGAPQASAVRFQVMPSMEQVAVNIAVENGTPAPAPAPPPVTSLIPADFALDKIKVDKNSLTLKAGESGQLILANTASSVMMIAWVKTEGFEVTPERAELKAGEKTNLTVKALAGAPHASTLRFQVMPTMEQVVVKITVE
jgi:uncharacterized cupredoxin-like copper-binding protein